MENIFEKGCLAQLSASVWRAARKIKPEQLSEMAASHEWLSATKKLVDPDALKPINKVVNMARGYQKADSQQWDYFEKIELGPAIKRAKKAGLIDSQMEKKLDSFRKTIRNPYNHFNIKKLTQDVVAEKVKVVDTESGAIEEQNLPAKDNPMIQAQVKPFVDDYHVIPVFYFADEVVKYLLTKIKYPPPLTHPNNY